MTTRIIFRGGRQRFRQMANGLMDSLAGLNGAGRDVAEGFLSALGFAALTDIKTAFVVKARGGRDAMGIEWPKLSKKYLAYQRRFGPGEQAKLKRAAGLGKGNRFAPGGKHGLLSAQELKRWRKVYAQRLSRFLLSMNEETAKRRAAAIAWTVLKSEGAKTKLDVFGNRQVEILRDTGVLLNSLSPGRLSPGGTYTIPHAEQIFELRQASVIVGTNVEYAAVHNYGNRNKPKMPRRQFLPDDERQIPEQWMQRWLNIGQKAIEVGFRRAIERGHL